MITLVEPRLSPYIALLTAVCLAFGAATLLGFVALLQAPSDRWTDVSGRLLLIQSSLSAVLLPTVLFARRWLRRRSTAVQRVLAAIAWLAFSGLSTAIVMWFDG